MRSRWYCMASGLLLANLAGALVLALVPITYFSTATVVVMPPKRPSTAASARNPLQGIDSSVHATASLLTQSMAGPLLTFRAGVNPRTDSVSTKNSARGAYVGESATPFITVRVESTEAQRSADLTGWLVQAGQEDLTQRQRALKVAPRNSVALETVVAATPPEMIWVPTVSASAVTLLLGLVLTTVLAYGLDRADIRRRRDELARVLPLPGRMPPLPATVAAGPATTPAQPAEVAPEPAAGPAEPAAVAAEPVARPAEPAALAGRRAAG